MCTRRGEPVIGARHWPTPQLTGLHRVSLELMAFSRNIKGDYGKAGVGRLRTGLSVQANRLSDQLGDARLRRLARQRGRRRRVRAPHRAAWLPARRAHQRLRSRARDARAGAAWGCRRSALGALGGRVAAPDRRLASCGCMRGAARAAAGRDAAEAEPCWRTRERLDHRYLCCIL